MKNHFARIAALLMMISAPVLGGHAAWANTADACVDKTTEVGVFKCFGSQFLAFDAAFLSGSFTATPYTVGKNQFWRIETVLASGVKLAFTGSNNSIKAIMLNPNKAVSSSLFTLESVTVGGNTQAVSINNLRAGVSAAVLAVAPDAVVDPKAPYKVNADGSLVFEHSISGHAVAVNYPHGQSTPQATVDGLTIAQHEARILTQLTALHAASGGTSGISIEVGQVRLTGGQITFNATISGQVISGSVSGSSGGSGPAVQLNALDPAVIGPRVAEYLGALFGRPVATVEQGRGVDGILRYTFTAGADLVVEVDPFGTPRLKFAAGQEGDPLLYVPLNTAVENVSTAAGLIFSPASGASIVGVERIGNLSCDDTPCPEPGSVHVTVSLNVPSTDDGPDLAMTAVFETYIDPELGVRTRIFSLKGEDLTDHMARLRQELGLGIGDFTVGSVRTADGQIVFEVTVGSSGIPQTVSLPLVDTTQSWDRVRREILRLFGAAPDDADNSAQNASTTVYFFNIKGFPMRAVVPASDQQPVVIAPMSAAGQPFNAQQSARIFEAIASARLHAHQNYGQGLQSSDVTVNGMTAHQACIADEPVEACLPVSLSVTIFAVNPSSEGTYSTATYYFPELMAGASPNRVLRQLRQYQSGALVLEAEYNEAGFLTHERSVHPGGSSTTDITRDSKNRETISVMGSGSESGNQLTVIYTTYASDTDDRVIERRTTSENDPNGGPGTRSSETVIEAWDAQAGAYNHLTITHVFDASDPSTVLETRVTYREGNGPARQVYNLGGDGRIEWDTVWTAFKAPGFVPQFTTHDAAAAGRRAFEQAFGWQMDDAMEFTETEQAPDGSITFRKTMGSVFQVTVGPDGSASAVEMLDENRNVADGSDFAERAMAFVGGVSALAGAETSAAKIESLMQYGNIQCEAVIGIDCPSMGDWNATVSLVVPSGDPSAPHRLRAVMDQRSAGGEDGGFKLMALIYQQNNIYPGIQQYLADQEGAAFTGFSVQGDRLRFSFTTADGYRRTGSVRLADGSDLNIDPDHGDPDFEIAVNAINNALSLTNPISYGDLTGDGSSPGAHVMTWGAVQAHVAEGWSSADVYVGGMTAAQFMSDLLSRADSDFGTVTGQFGYGPSVRIHMQPSGANESLIQVRLVEPGGEAYWSYKVHSDGTFELQDAPSGSLVDSLVGDHSRSAARRAFEQAFGWQADDSMEFTEVVDLGDGSKIFRKTMGSVFQVTVSSNGKASVVEMLDENRNVVDGSDFAQRALGFVGQAAALAGMEPSAARIESLMQYGNIQCADVEGIICPSMGDWTATVSLALPSDDPSAPHQLFAVFDQPLLGGKRDGAGGLTALIYGQNNIYAPIQRYLSDKEGGVLNGFSIQGDRLHFSFAMGDGRQQTGSVRLADGSDLSIDPDHGDPDFEVAVRAINEALPLATPVTYGDLTGDGSQPGAHVMTWGAVQVHVAEGWSSAEVFIGGLRPDEFIAKLQQQADQDFAAVTNFWGYGSSVVIDGIETMGQGQSLVRVRLSGAGGDAYWSYGVNEYGDLYANEMPSGALVDSLIPRPDPMPDPYNPDPGYYDPSMGGGYDPSTGYDPNLGYDPTLYPDPVYPDPYQPWVDTMMQEAAAQQRIAEIFGDLSTLDLGYQGVQETTWDGYLTARWNHIAVQVDSNYGVVEARLLDESGNTVSDDLQGVINTLTGSILGLVSHTDPVLFRDFRVESGQIIFKFEQNGQTRTGSADTSGGNVWLMPDHGDPDFEVAVNALNSALPLASPVTMSDLTGDPSGAPHVMTWGAVQVHVADMWTSAECFIAMPDGTLVPAHQAIASLQNAVEARVPGYGSSARIQSIAAVDGGIRFEMVTDAAGTSLKADLDAAGQIVRTEVRYSNTGEFGGFLWDTEATSVYNAAGVQIVYQESQKKSGLSGGLQYSITFDYEYDDQGRSIRERTVETDYDQGTVTGSHEYGADCAYSDDGSVSCVSTDLHRDELGQVMRRSVWEQDFWTASGIQYEKIDIFNYDGQDRLTSVIRNTSKYDMQRNFLGFDVATVETHTYELDAQNRLIRETITVLDHKTSGKTVSIIDYDPFTGRPLKDVEAEKRQQAKELIAATFDLSSQEEFELDLGTQDANGDWHFQWAQGGIIDVVLAQDGSVRMNVSDTDGKATGVDVLNMFSQSSSKLGGILQSEDHGLETYWIEIMPAQDVLEVDYENPLFDEEGNFAGFGEKWVHYDAVYTEVYGLPMPQAYVSNAKIQWIEVVGQGMNCVADGSGCELGTVKIGITGTVMSPDQTEIQMTARLEQTPSDESPRIVSFKLNGVDYARKAADDLGDRMEQKLDVTSVKIQGSEVKITITWDGVPQEEKTYSIGSPEPSGGHILYDPLTGTPIATTNLIQPTQLSGLGTLTPLSGQVASVPVLTVQNDLIARPAGTLSIITPAPSLQVNTGVLDSLADRNQLFANNGASTGPYQNSNTMNSQSQMGPFQAPNDND